MDDVGVVRKFKYKDGTSASPAVAAQLKFEREIEPTWIFGHQDGFSERTLPLPWRDAPETPRKHFRLQVEDDASLQTLSIKSIPGMSRMGALGALCVQHRPASCVFLCADATLSDREQSRHS